MKKPLKSLGKSLDGTARTRKMPDISRGRRCLGDKAERNALISSSFALNQPREKQHMAKAAKPAGKKPGGKKAMTKSQFIGHLADKAEVTKKQVDTILTEIVEVIKKEVGPSGPKKFVFPGLARFVLKQKAAVKGGERKINPLTKTEYITKDKPAQNIIRARPVKALTLSLNS
jgi:nucleoid DNA-binding protein